RRDYLSYTDSYARSAALRVARMMPQLPSNIQTMLWLVALGEAKSDRPQARAALVDDPSALPRSLTALTDGKQAIRIAAAEMLRDLKDEAAIEPLKKALRKEKQELVKGAMLQALEAVGADVEEFLGRRKQLNDAKKGLDKKRPKGMEWVPLDGLPKVRWEDGKAVAPEIVQWWVVQSIQFKLPTPGALLKRSLEMCKPEDTAQLAAFVLSVWIEFDIQTMDRDEAVAQATQQAAAQWQSSQWTRNI
ncbi:MAG: HEAT repeat domain-containing protein, partial [Cyanobacteria bacterium J06648_11]